MKDGDYAIRDVFKYMTCKSEISTYTSCPKNTIYEPGRHKCVSISTQSHETFCQNRSTGDWVNPWNCHHFYKCYFGVTHDFNCQLPILVYNPYDDQCVYPQKYSCHQVSPKQLTTGAKNPCEFKGDGMYGIPDVFAYLKCKKHVATYVNCKAGLVFEEKSKKCVHGSKLTKKNFCNDRSTGDYRDPWDCHSFITCVHDTFLERPCAVKDLVYDPYNNSKFKKKKEN